MSSEGVISCLPYMNNVEFLSLRESTIKDEVLHALYSVNLPRIVLIDISSCAQINDEAVKTLQLQLAHVLVNIHHEKSKKYQTDSDK